MKIKRTMVLIALFAACQAVAQQATNTLSASATMTVKQPKLHWFAPVTMTNSAVNLKPVEGSDPRAWSTIVGWHPGESAFATAETRQGGWPLFWIDLGSSPAIKHGGSGGQR